MTIAVTTHGKQEAAAGAHQGKIIGITDDKLVMKSEMRREERFDMAYDVRVTHAGKPCSVRNLRLGVTVRITTRKDDEHTAVAIERVERV